MPAVRAANATFLGVAVFARIQWLGLHVRAATTAETMAQAQAVVRRGCRLIQGTSDSDGVYTDTFVVVLLPLLLAAAAPPSPCPAPSSPPAPFPLSLGQSSNRRSSYSGGRCRGPAAFEWAGAPRMSREPAAPARVHREPDRLLDVLEGASSIALLVGLGVDTRRLNARTWRWLGPKRWLGDRHSRWLAARLLVRVAARPV